MMYSKITPMVLLLTLLITPSNGQGSTDPIPPKLDLDLAFKEAAEANHVDLNLLRAMCWVESSHKIKRPKLDGESLSYGVCQVKFYTARWQGFGGTAKDLNNPFVNTYYAAKILKHWLKRSKGNWQRAVSAYNRGHYERSLRVQYVALIGIALYEHR